MLLNEFDGGKAVIEPSVIEKIEGMPKACIAVFSYKIRDEWVEKYNAEVIGHFNSVTGMKPIYKMNVDGHEFAFYMPSVGAPAAVGELEEAIAFGCESFVFLGCCGVLRHDIADGHLIVPTAAIRDEGTSFHYAEADDEIALNPRLVKLAEDTMNDLGLPFVGGKTWTTDAFFRETPAKVEKAKSMGAICVEMECSALQAVADFRKVDFIQFLWSADNLDAPEWDRRGLSTKGESVSAKCMTAAIEISKRMR